MYRNNRITGYWGEAIVLHKWRNVCLFHKLLRFRQFLSLNPGSKFSQSGTDIWVKVFKNGPSEIFGRQLLKKLKWYGLLSTNFTWSILEHFVPFLTKLHTEGLGKRCVLVNPDGIISWTNGIDMEGHSHRSSWNVKPPVQGSSTFEIKASNSWEISFQRFHVMKISCNEALW